MIMKINLQVFVSSVKEKNQMEALVKTFESTIRPYNGDIIADQGFDADFHNGYEVVKVTIDYDADECWVSLSPLQIEKEDISCTAYIEKLKNHGWRVLMKEELS